MSLNEIWNLIKRYHSALGIPRTPVTSVVSPIFPGQFNYCLDERHLLEKYGNLIDVTEEEHFQKMMPVVRWADFDEYLDANGKWSSDHHFATFTMTTIGGGHIVSSRDGARWYGQSVTTLIDFLTHQVGLERERIHVSYFGGGASLKNLESARRKKVYKIESNFTPPRQESAIRLFSSAGIPRANIKESNSRGCFLITNWDVFRAPMGYRNEIHYLLRDGSFLDIATVEWLIYEPIVEKRHEINYVVEVQPWRNSFSINGLGIERVLMARQNLTSIFKLKEYKLMTATGVEHSKIETIRILHRVFTDEKFEEIQSTSRRSKLNYLMRFITDTSLDYILLIMNLNAIGYSKIFPELRASIEYVMSQLTHCRLTTLRKSNR